MYLSLKGSLGHTPITDRVGENLLQIAEGASAAYSLRNLGSDSPAVVRVRRESDNNERDFTAQDISTSVLTNWVNEQITPPLDLRELTATGRDGPIIEAAAAYSLRNLSDSYTGDVVEVRRNTDGALKDFKASEVTDGTLEAWVNTSFANALPLDTASGAAAAYSLRNLSSSYTGSVVEVRRSSDDAVRSFTAAEVTDGTLVAWVGAGNDGTVSKWYDQSGNDNHATQGTPASQPKIVDGGSLVTGGLDFDGVADVLETSLVPPNVATLIGVANWDVINVTGMIIGARDSVTKRSYLAQVSTGKTALGVASSPLGGPDVVTRDDYLLFGTYSGSTRLLSTNGSVVSDSDGSSPNNTIHGYSIGALNTAGENSSFMTGTIQEVIVYESDQTDKRRAIEENIGSTYGITLPSSKDGTVSKWYDQSTTSGVPNANHAVQTDAASQPKIVDGGVLVTRNGDAAIKSTSGNVMNFTLDSLSADGQQSVFAVLENDVTSQNTHPKAFDVSSNTANDAHGGNGANFRPRWTTTPSGELFFQVDSFGGYNTSSRERHLYSHVMNDTAGGTSTVNQDGTQVDTRSITLDANPVFASGTLLQTASNITGALYISEVIYYPSDQSDNRTALEANIGEVYGISGIPAYEDTVNGFVETWYDQSSSAVTNYDPYPTIASGSFSSTGVTFQKLPLGNADERTFTLVANNSTDTRYVLFVRASNGIRTGKHRIAFDLTLNSGSIGTITGFYTDRDADPSNGGSYGTYSLTEGSNVIDFEIFNDGVDASPEIIWAINTGSTFDISVTNFEVSHVTETIVRNGNDATQSVASYQPKIVDAGALVQEGGNPSLEFDGPSSKRLITTKGYIVELSQNSASVFVVAKATTTNNSGYILAEGDAVDTYSSSFIINGPPTTNETLWVNTVMFGTGYPLNTQALGGFIYDGITFQAYLNGSANGSAGTVDLLPETSLQSYIGSAAAPNITSQNHFSGLISEIIAYKSDQSANRVAIEANINNQYDIY